MNTKLLPFLVFAFMVGSCSVLDGNADKSQLVGQWRWVQSTGGIAGQTITPESSGSSAHYIHYDTDQTFSLFQADTLVYSGKYSVEKRNEEIWVAYEIEGTGFYPDERLEFEGNDTLILLDNCADCYRSVYVREN